MEIGMWEKTNVVNMVWVGFPLRKRGEDMEW